jgi:ankyrin repeat protein
MTPRKNAYESSALRQAVLSGDLSAVKHEIEQGADINLRDRDGRGPLFDAVFEGHLAIAAELIRQGFDVNATDKDLETLLHVAAREYRIGLAELLLENGARVDSQDSHGNTPLFRAVFDSQGRGEMIKLLLAHSANRNLKNNHGVSPFDLAHSIANYRVSVFLE